MVVVPVREFAVVELAAADVVVAVEVVDAVVVVGRG